MRVKMSGGQLQNRESAARRDNGIMGRKLNKRKVFGFSGRMAKGDSRFQVCFSPHGRDLYKALVKLRGNPGIDGRDSALRANSKSCRLFEAREQIRKCRYRGGWDSGANA